jgi:hypothetical protein
MKKFITIAAVALLATAFTTSCTNDKAKGKKDGKAYCDCLEKNSDNILGALSCVEYVTDATKESTEYQEAFAEAAAGCMEEE